jgi:hypothetical protein
MVFLVQQNEHPWDPAKGEFRYSAMGEKDLGRSGPQYLRARLAVAVCSTPCRTHFSIFANRAQGCIALQAVAVIPIESWFGNSQPNVTLFGA